MPRRIKVYEGSSTLPREDERNTEHPIDFSQCTRLMKYLKADRC